MAIFTLSELASYLQQDLDTATATLIQTLTDGLIAEQTGTVAIPAPVSTKAVALEVAARAYRNPNAIRQEAVGQWSYTRDAAAASGVFLTVANLALLLSPGESGDAYSIIPFGEPGYSTVVDSWL